MALLRWWSSVGALMFFRRKISGRTEYLQIVKNERIEGKPRQSVVATLGRADEKWRRGLVIDGVAGLELHQLYRAMGWLGDALADQCGHGLGPRTTKDLVEEQLFTLRNNLFSELSLVFLDTTSLYFEGEGG